MHKKFIALATATAILAVSGLASAQTLKLGMGDPIDSDQGALAVRFKELVETYSNGEITVDLFPGGALGAETEMLQNARMGSLDFALVGIGNVTPFAKELGALTLPYIIENTSDAVKMTTGPINDRWNEIAGDAGLRIVAWTYSNFRFLTNSVRPVTKLEDLAGMKVRVPQNKVMLATYDAWGASPIAMAWPEVFTGLQQGVIDGQDNPYIVNYTMKFHEVQDHLTEVHYNYSLQPLVAGTRTFEKWTPEQQAMIMRAGLEAQLYSLMFQLEQAGAAKQGMIDAGVTVHTLEDEDQWIALAKDEVWPAFYDEVGGKEFIDGLLAQLGR
ncbi:MAG: TRAP transporter substrate-binding protein [Inquilinaceae bacterium]